MTEKENEPTIHIIKRPRYTLIISLALAAYLLFHILWIFWLDIVNYLRYVQFSSYMQFSLNGFIWMFVFIYVILAGLSSVWAYADAELRKKPGWLVALMVFILCWPLGLFIWIVFRPNRMHGKNSSIKLYE